MRRMMTLWQPLLNFLFPPRCPGCRRHLRTVGWCPDCAAAYRHPRAIAGAGSRELRCCYALGDYRGALRQALIDLKFHGRQSHAATFAPWLTEFPWPEIWTGRTAIPIPLSAERLHERGFDQVEALFRKPLQVCGCTWLPKLRKVRHTVPQSGLSKPERRTNIKGSFRWEGASLATVPVLLVDDIYTTGATLHEAAHVLRRAGATDIIGLVIASGAS